VVSVSLHPKTFRWKVCSPIFSKQFAVVGVHAKEGEALLKESECMYKVYTTGRQYCKGMIAELDVSSVV
jgi:hypothetical protein